MAFLNVSPNSVAIPITFNTSQHVTAYVGKLVWDVTADSGTPPLSTTSDLITFCIELTEYVSSSANPYNKVSVDSALTSSKASLLDKLADNYWDDAMGSTLLNAVAFQLAVWEIVYDETSLNVTSGTGFNVTSSSSYAAAITTANNWLTSLATDPSDNNLSVFALTNAGKQNQFAQYATPVQQNQTGDLPEPLSLVVWGGLLGACGVSFRRTGC